MYLTLVFKNKEKKAEKEFSAGFLQHILKCSDGQTVGSFSES